MAKRKPVEACAFCGKIGPAERDHVPPKGIFQKPLPGDLITVPICPACHRPTGIDDEYFLTMLGLSEDIEEASDSGGGFQQKVIRDLNRPEKRAFITDIASTLELHTLLSQSGLYIGKKIAYGVDMDRIGRVVDRIIYGLFWKTTRRPVPKTHFVRSFEIKNYISTFGFAEKQKIAPYIIMVCYNGRPPISIGNGVFQYKYVLNVGDPNASLWVLRFYKKVNFFGATAPLASYAPIETRT